MTAGQAVPFPYNLTSGYGLNIEKSFTALGFALAPVAWLASRRGEFQSPNRSVVAKKDDQSTVRGSFLIRLDQELKASQARRNLYGNFVVWRNAAACSITLRNGRQRRRYNRNH